MHDISMTTRCIMSEALVDGIILIEMGEEIFEEEFGFKCFRSSITDEIRLTWILAKKCRRKDILKSVCMQHRTILTQNIPRKEGNQSYQTGNVYDLDNLFVHIFFYKEYIKT